MAFREDGDVWVGGTLSANKFTPPAGSIGDSAIAVGAGIKATKTQHQNRAHYAQPNTTAVTETKGLYVCYGATGLVIDVRAGTITPCVGAATITIDVKKNGTSILSGVITLNNSNAARVAAIGTVSGGTLVAGDWLEVVVAATAGGGTLGTGLLVVATIQEDAQ